MAKEIKRVSIRDNESFEIKIPVFNTRTREGKQFLNLVFADQCVNLEDGTASCCATNTLGVLVTIKKGESFESWFLSYTDILAAVLERRKEENLASPDEKAGDSSGG